MSWMCMVLFSQNTPFNMSAFLRHFQATWPNTLVKADEAAEGAGGGGGDGDGDVTHSFDVGDGSLVIGRMPVPIPDFTVNAERPPMFWPKAAEEVPKHRVHWIVTAPGESGKAIERARLLTQSVSSLLASQPGALGVTWGSHAHMVGAPVFQAMAAEINKGVDPYLLWVDIQCGWAPSGPSSGLSTGFTRGLSDFELKEFETLNATEPPSELHGRLLGLVEYVIKRGPVIRGGQTIGQSAEERIRVVETASSFGQENRILRLDYTGTAALATQGGGKASPVATTTNPVGLGAGNAASYGPGASVATPSANAFGVNGSGAAPSNAAPYGTSPAGVAPYGTSPSGTSPYGAATYGTNPYGAAPYGANPYGPGAVGPPTPKMSVAALMGFIFAVLSPFLFCLCFLNFPASVIAIVLGHLAIVQIGRSQGMLHGKGLAITSLVIGYPILLASLAFLSWIFVIAPATRPTAAPGFPSGLPMARNMFGDGQTGQGNGLEIELDEQPGKSNASTPPIPSSVPNSPGGAPGGTNIPGNPSGPLGGPLGGPQVPKMPESPQSPDVNSSASGMPRMPGTPGMPGMPSFPSRPQFPRPNFNLPPGVPDPFGNAGVPGSSPPGMPTPPNFPGFPGFPGTPGGPGFPTPNGGQSPPGGGDSTPNSTPRTTPKATPKSTPKTTPETTPDTTAGGVTGGPPSFNPFAPVPVDPDTVLASFPDMGWPVRSLSFSADGGRLAVGRIDAGFTVFDIESGKAVFQRDRLASLGAVVSLAWSPDGKYLFAGGQSGQLVSWEVEQPTAKPRNHKGHARNVACLVVGPEARFIISAGDDRSVTWQQPDAPDKARSLTLPGSGDILALRIGSPPITAMATDGKAIYEINLKTSAITNTVELERRPCQSADFSTDGSRLAVSEGREVKVYDTATGKPTLTIQVGSEMLWCVRYTPDNQQLVTGGRGMFYVFAPDSGKRLAGISVGQPLYVKTMAFDRESRQAAVIPDSAGQTLRVFRLPTTAPKSSP